MRGGAEEPNLNRSKPLGHGGWRAIHRREASSRNGIFALFDKVARAGYPGEFDHGPRRSLHDHAAVLSGEDIYHLARPGIAHLERLR